MCDVLFLLKDDLKILFLMDLQSIVDLQSFYKIILCISLFDLYMLKYIDILLPNTKYDIIDSKIIPEIVFVSIEENFDTTKTINMSYD